MNGAAKTSRLVELKDLIRSRGLRGTSSRATVLECLMSADAPMTHAEVCEGVAEAGLDRATIWRNLADLTEVGLLRRSDLGDHLWRFEFTRETDHEDDLHPHFVCTECGAVACLPGGVVTIQAANNSPGALKKGAYEVQVRGTCDDCN